MCCRKWPLCVPKWPFCVPKWPIFCVPKWPIFCVPKWPLYPVTKVGWCEWLRRTPCHLVSRVLDHPVAQCRTLTHLKYLSKPSFLTCGTKSFTKHVNTHAMMWQAIHIAWGTQLHKIARDIWLVHVMVFFRFGWTESLVRSQVRKAPSYSKRSCSCTQHSCAFASFQCCCCPIDLAGNKSVILCSIMSYWPHPCWKRTSQDVIFRRSAEPINFKYTFYMFWFQSFQSLTWFQDGRNASNFTQGFTASFFPAGRGWKSMEIIGPGMWGQQDVVVRGHVQVQDRCDLAVLRWSCCGHLPREKWSLRL